MSEILVCMSDLMKTNYFDADNILYYIINDFL